MRLNDEVKRLAALPEIQERFAREGFQAVHIPPDDFGRKIETDIEKWHKVVKAARVTLV